MEPKIKVLLATTHSQQPYHMTDLKLSNGRKAFKVFPASDEGRVRDLMSRHKFTVIIVDDSMGDIISSIVLENQKHDSSNKKTPVYYLSIDQRIDCTSFIKKGYKDVLFKPLDLPLVLQKIAVDAGISADGQQLYVAKTSEETSVTIVSRIENVSEYSVTLSMGHPLKIGELIQIEINDHCGKNGKVQSYAEVSQCAQSKSDPSLYSVTTVLRGSSPAFIQNVRRLIKLEFVTTRAS